MKRTAGALATLGLAALLHGGCGGPATTPEEEVRATIAAAEQAATGLEELERLLS